MCTLLQITQNHVVARLLLHYKNELMKVIKELRLPYNIEVLAQIRRDCYQHNFSDPNTLQNGQVLVSDVDQFAFDIFIYNSMQKCIQI